MQKLRSESIIRRLKGEGFRFSQFSMTSEGDYAADDADWNYKDIPHLHHVHALAEAHPAYIADDVICTVNLQRILGIWFPIALVNYELEKNRQVYFTTLLFFTIIVETVIEEIAPIRTRVCTTYHIGHPRWLAPVVPALRWLIKRNYRVLMEADLPMRDRRGALRKLGYGFAKRGESYNFPDTLRIFDKNVLLPAQAVEASADYQQAFDGQSQCFIGDNGLMGLRLIREGDTVSIWPRTCPHEGALLDAERCSAEKTLTCPWHGRKFTEIGSFRWGQDAEIVDKDYRVQVTNHRITWLYLGALADSRAAA